MEWNRVAPPSEAGPPLEGSPGVEDLEAALRPAWVDVDLDALEHNLARIRGRLGEPAPGCRWSWPWSRRTPTAMAPWA